METNIPLPSPINRFGFHGLRKQKAEAKVEKKLYLPCFFPFFPSRPSLWLALSSRLNRRYNHQTLVGLPCNTRNVADHFFGQAHVFCFLPPPASHCMQNLHAAVAFKFLIGWVR